MIYAARTSVFICHRGFNYVVNLDPVPLGFKGICATPLPVVESFHSDPAWPARVKLAPTMCREVEAVSTYAFEWSRFAQVATPPLFLLGSDGPPVCGALPNALECPPWYNRAEVAS